MAIVDAMAGRTIGAAAAWVASRELDVEVHGRDNVPADGPVLLVARHYHHLYDGVALLTAVPRRLHLVVALDWARTRVERAVMEWATRAARWPALLRDDAIAAGLCAGTPSAFRPDESPSYRLRAIRAAVQLLQEGAAVVVFPEGYPNVDPRWTPKNDLEQFLPFRAGFTVIRQQASKRARVQVPIVPVGLAYEPGSRWRATVRFGAPLPSDVPAAQVLWLTERRVRALSAPPEGRADAAAASALSG